MYVDEIDFDAPLLLKNPLILCSRRWSIVRFNNWKKKHWSNVIKLMVINGQDSENAFKVLDRRRAVDKLCRTGS